MTAPANQPSDILDIVPTGLVPELVDVLLDQVTRNAKLRAELNEERRLRAEEHRLRVEAENDRDYWRREAEVNHDHAREVAERRVCPACFGPMFEE